MLIKHVENLTASLDANAKELEERKAKAVDNTKKFQQELDRLNTMFLKGRITEDFYDTEYLRLTDLIAQNKANTEPQGQSERLKDIFTDSWKETYQGLDKLHKKLFWRDIIKEIVVDKDMQVIDVYFL